MKQTMLILVLATCAIGADRATSWPTTQIRRGMVFSPTTNPEERQRNAMETIAKRIEPSLHGDASRLPQYLEFFKREFVKDPRVFAFDCSAEAAGDGLIHLTGHAEYVEHAHVIERLLATLGFARIENEIEQLPAKELAAPPYGIVTAARTFSYDKPASPHEQVTECLSGEPLFLLRKVLADDREYFFCHNVEGYLGYVSAADVRVVEQSELTARINERPPDPRIARVIESAKSILGTEYVWGGKTDQGLDCSGLVQRAFKAAGVNLPRDADQQALVGRMVATRLCRDAMREGDVMFFLGRRGTVSHTAIYLGDGKYIEAAGTVKISSIDRGADESGRRRVDSFCFARRVLEP